MITVKIQDIVEHVCKHFGLFLDDIRIKNKQKTVSIARFVCYYLCKFYNKSYSEIADYMHRDISTVREGLKKVRDDIENFGADVHYIITVINHANNVESRNVASEQQRQMSSAQI
jgi:chromosomal replication initiation ATPase DnaA